MVAKIIGIVGIVGGTIMLLIGGGTQSFIIDLVGIVALAFALIVGILKTGVKNT